MEKPKLKLIVDLLLYVDLCALIATGAILGLIIPPGGGGRWFFGLHRHDWGDIHGFLSLLLIGLVVAHLTLSWRWVLGAARRHLGFRWERTLLSTSVAWIGLLAIAWLFVRCG